MTKVGGDARDVFAVSVEVSRGHVLTKKVFP
jgi:hypothetical protein